MREVKLALWRRPGDGRDGSKIKFNSAKTFD